MKYYRLLGFLVLLVEILAACGPAESEAATDPVAAGLGVQRFIYWLGRKGRVRLAAQERLDVTIKLTEDERTK